MILRRSFFIAAVVIAMGFFGKNMLSSRKAPPQRSADRNQHPLVEVVELSNGNVEASINVTGRLRAKNKISVITEATGKLKPGGKRFAEGSSFQAGEAILRLDDTEQRLNLSAQRAAFQSQLLAILTDLSIDYPESAKTWEEYIYAIDPEKRLAALPEVEDERENNFLAVNSVYNSYYSIKSAEARLDKFTVYAPFSGVISQGQIDPGTLVRSGVELGQFMEPGSFQLEASVPLADLQYIEVNQLVDLKSDEISGSWQGRVARIAKAIDPSTQTVKVYIYVKGSELREGMYLHGNVQEIYVSEAVEIDRNLITEDQGLWVLKQDSILSKKPVEVIRTYSDKAAIRGLSDGEVVPVQTLGGAYEGLIVRKQNSVQ
jgi:multidrug efflux pump subunit AcrA (membrane-fusion protein)